MEAEASKLRHKIGVYGKVKAMNELNETKHVDGLIKTISASILPQTAKMQNQAVNTILTNVTHKIVVRYKAGKDITNDMHIMFGDHRFDIRFILNPNFSNEVLEIYVEEWIG